LVNFYANDGLAYTLVEDLEFQLDKLDPYAAAQDIKPFLSGAVFMKIDKEQQGSAGADNKH